ncbi:MAG: hypothetical protein BGP24_07615 [Lysobacterales bacterium 69-70]|nr:MAG: hypothetical protein BGP24_07615 [Xanthomonadales bacterium 69-70]
MVVPVIHGVGDTKEFTIWRAVQETPSARFPGGIEQTFHKLRVVVGAHMGREADERFSGVAFDAAQIGPWMVKQPVKRSVSIEDSRGLKTTHEINADRTDSFGPTADGITYLFGSNVETKTEDYLSYGFETQPGVHMDFSDVKTCAESMDRVERTAELLSLLVGEHVEPQAIRLYGREEKSGFNLLYEFRPPSARKLMRAAEVLAPLPNIRGIFPAVLDAWDRERPRMRDVVSLLLDAIDRDAPQTHLRMLLLAQALEAFHRNVVGGAYMSPNDYESVRQALTAAIPAQVEKDHRNALTSRIRFGNELSLRTRLKQLVNSLADDSLTQLGIDGKTFVGEAVDARNDYTHWVLEREQNRPDGAPLGNLVSNLLAIAQLVVLKHLGVAEELVVDQMKKFSWRYLRRYQAIVEPEEGAERPES